MHNHCELLCVPSPGTHECFVGFFTGAMGHLLSLQAWWSEGIQPLRTSSVLRRRQLGSRIRPKRASSAGGSVPRGDRTPVSHPAPTLLGTYCVAQANLKEESLFLSNLGFGIAGS